MTTPFQAWHATTPTPTPADELDRGAALAMGWVPTTPPRVAGWLARRHGLDVIVKDWHPKTDPAQALQFAQATADALGEPVSLVIRPQAGADAYVTGEPAEGQPATALTTACLDAWRAREGA